MTAPYGKRGVILPGSDQWVLMLDHDKLDPFMEAWRDDKVTEYLSAHPGEIPSLGDRAVE